MPSPPAFFISIAFVFYITATTGTAGMPYGVAKLIGGICFSLGLILVVVCGADLFTSTVLIVVAKASGRITWGQLARNWINVYFGNLVGALFFCRADLVRWRAYDGQRRMGPQCIANRRSQNAPQLY
ncbi:formate/nitrite transporter family protein [Pantoea tagorei]